MRPEIILKYLDIFSTVEKYKEVITYGYRSILVVHKFIKKLNKTSINLDLYKGELYGHLNLIAENITHFTNNALFNEIRPLSVNTKITKTDFSTNPDYIIVNPNSDVLNAKHHTYQELLFHLYKKWKLEHLLEKFNLNTYGIKTKGITTLENEIIYNGDKYILDSCLLSNFNTNSKGSSHAITGITCNNNRFVYNGWRIREVQNKETQLSFKKLPCELMKLHWDIHNPIPFCLNLTMCKLDPGNLNEKDDFCFSFDRGPRNLIYVKVKNLDKKLDMYQNFSSSNALTLPSTSKLSNIDEINQKRKIKEILIKKLEAKKREKEAKKREIEENKAKKQKEEKKKQKKEEKKLKEEKKKQKEEEKKLKEEKKKQKEEEKKLKEEKKKQKEEKKREKEAKKKQKEEKEVKKKEKEVKKKEKEVKKKEKYN